MTKKALIIMGLFVLIAACGPHALEFNIRFQAVDGLKAGAPVVHAGQPIGAVKQVTYTNKGDFLVAVSIEEAFKHVATHDSFFFIAGSTADNPKRIAVLPGQADAAPIEADQTIDGVTHWAAKLRQMQARLEDQFGRLADEFESVWSELAGISESDQIKRLERKLDEMIARLGTLSDAVKQKLKTDILPKLERQVEELRKKLESMGRGKEIAPLEKKIQRISEELRVY